MHINHAAIFHRQANCPAYGADTKVTGKFIVWDRADNVSAHLERLLHKTVSARIGIHPLLRKGNNLNGDEVPQLLPQLQHSP